jgi:hypothetical protein
MENVATIPSRRQNRTKGWMRYQDPIAGGTVAIISTANM